MAQPAMPAGDSQYDSRVLAGLKPTRQRVAVLRAVESLEVFSGAQAIHDVLGGAGDHVSLSTVYRSLQALAGRGVIDAVRGLDGEMLYRRCAVAPHHHLVCRRCGRAVEIADGAVAQVIRRWARAASYEDVEYDVVAFGTCPRCLARAPTG